MAKRSPVLHIDCDGVLADFRTKYYQSACDLLGVAYDAIDLAEVYEWEVLVGFSRLRPELFPDGEKHFRQGVIEQLVTTKGWCSSMAPIPGAAEALAEVRKMMPVHVVTTPWHTSPFWHFERTKWLKKHMGVDPADLTFSSKKHLVGKRGDVFVDDSAKHVNGWADEHDEHAVLWCYPGARSRIFVPTNVYTCAVAGYNWSQLLDIVRKADIG